jgi:dienelactone hydrolase
MGISINAQHGVVIHKIVYETIGPWGGKVQASGMLALPQTEGPAWPLVSYQHGTLTQRSDAPSAASDLEGLVFASTGYVTVLPDYLGLGDSSGVQFYLHARTTATTGVDLIRAVRTFCTNQSISLNGQVFLCGFSQGGHATLAMLREIEKFHANEFTISAAAPIAGPYDLSESSTEDILSGRLNSPVFLSLLLASYQEIYHLAPSWADILKAPYDVNIPPLLNGEHSFEEIAELLPNRPSDVLRPQYLAAFRDNPKHPLRLALRESDVIGWKPLAPVRLYHCHADEVVLYANSTSARESFQRQGATQVQVVDPAPSIDYSHGSGFLPCMELTKAWFDSLKW